jgi:DNA-binding transcriptional MerR regulator
MKQTGCNHKSIKCRCYDFDDPKWNEALRKAWENNGMTLEEIGSVMGVTRMAVCTQEKRLLAKVRDILERRNITKNDIDW